MNQLVTTDKIPLPIVILYTYRISNTVITWGKKNSFMYLAWRKNLRTGILMSDFDLIPSQKLKGYIIDR